ncbi:MAG: O-antigen ligase family protein, partial [Pirellulales bacterium]
MGPILVYTAFAFICIGAFARPTIGAVGYIGFVAFEPTWLWRYQLDAAFPFQKWIVACLLLGWMFHFFRTRNLSLTSVIPLGLLVAVLALGHLSAAESYAPEKSEFFLRQFNKIVLMSTVVALALSSKRVIEIALVVMAIGISYNAFEINADYYRQGFSLVNQDGWSKMNANGYALIMLIGTLFTFALAQYSTSTIGTAGWLVASVVNAHAIMIVESRGAMLGLAVAGVFHLIFVRRTPKNIGLTASILVAGLVLAGPPVLKEFSSIFAEKLDNSGESRFYIWDAGYRISLDYPLLGVGPWAGEVLVPAYYQGTDKTGMEIIALHNLELEISTGIGIPATLAYLAFFFLPWNQARKMIWKDKNMPTNESSAMLYGSLLA